VIALRSDLKVVLAAQPVDFRKSLHTLSALVSEALRANPYCGDVFVFCSKRKDLAADPRRCSASERDAAYDAARRARVDACVAQACEAADVVG
jgi:transposase